MAKDLEDLFQDTSIYLPKGNVLAVTKPLPLSDIYESLSNSVFDIHGRILDFDDGPTVHFKIEKDVTNITLGKLGTYTFPTNIDVLTQVSIRLQDLSQSPRFIKAIQGLWPA